MLISQYLQRIYILPKNHSCSAAQLLSCSAAQLLSCSAAQLLSYKSEITDCSTMPQKQRTVTILAIMPGGALIRAEQRRYNCEITSHTHMPWYRRYYLNREVLYWLQFSITGSIFCGSIAILKTLPCMLKDTRMTSFLIRHQMANNKGFTREKI